MILKFCSPAWNILHFTSAHTIASIFSSIIAYLDSALDRKWSLPVLGCIYLRMINCCCRTKSNPCLLASVYNRTGIVRWKNSNTCDTTNSSFQICLRKNAWCADQIDSWYSGEASVVILTLQLCWFLMRVDLPGHKRSAIVACWGRKFGYCFCNVRYDLWW